MALLQEFRKEEAERLEKFQKLYEQADDQFEEQQQQQDIEDFKEDWQLSQFWYNERTANLLAEELLDGADKDTIILVISVPSVYAAMTKLRAENKLPKGVTLANNVYLFEFDTRFRAMAGNENFVHYDLNHPLENLPEKLLKKSHRILIDPPFLSDDCQTKIAVTVRALLNPDKSVKTENGDLQYKLISCTGERMHKLMSKVFPDIKITNFLPEHERGLSNEFRCYATYESKNWKFV